MRVKLITIRDKIIMHYQKLFQVNVKQKKGSMYQRNQL